MSVQYVNDSFGSQNDLDGDQGLLMINSDNSDDSCNDSSGGGGGGGCGSGKGTFLREQDRFLPIANVAKIMKKAIPDSCKIAKDARECVQECVSEFISFITSEASERCHQEKRKTINGEDILYAMCSLGFDSYIDPLKVYLNKYRETTKADRHVLATNDSSVIFEESSNDFKIDN